MRNISLAQSANITWAKPKYHVSPLAKYITAIIFHNCPYGPVTVSTGILQYGKRAEMW